MLSIDDCEHHDENLNEKDDAYSSSILEANAEAAAAAAGLLLFTIDEDDEDVEPIVVEDANPKVDEDAKPKVRKQMASRSEIWQHFIKVLDGQGLVKEGKCKYCDRSIQATTSGNGTTTMRKHFTICKHSK